MRVTRRRVAVFLLILVVIFCALLFSAATRLTPYVRHKAVAALEARFQSDLELTSFRAGLFPRPEVAGEGFILRHNGRTDVPPLIRIKSYSATAGLLGLVRSPLHLRTIHLDGLEISVPPRGVKAPRVAASVPQPSPAASPTALAPERSEAPGPPPAKTPRLIIDRIVARAARLEIVSRDKGKLPRVFEIHDLEMQGVGDGVGATFRAQLTNPKPLGQITTHGTFGPWRSGEPRQTPIRGEYAFKDANLDTIKGIAGRLSSIGQYSGVLERIEVNGETDTPDFSVDIAGQPVSLKTRFQAIVDGTNGDTFLEKVEARVLETFILARGAVVRTEDVKGRKVELEAKIDNGRIEDVLKLGMKSARPVMTGRMHLATTFLLPAGDRDILDKLELSGTFRLDQARFANMDIQRRIDTLSRRGQGQPEAEGPSVVSRLSGKFSLRDGTLRFADLSFGVPGAIVQLAGTYDLRREALDFRGHLLLDASLAETTTGWRSIAARLAQPFFRRRGGGSKLPIKVTGPREKPEFGLDVKSAFKR
ncbi:MAG: hypothetical protein H0W18_04450 [Acidobacteria bacterium]|nr:hypothetical protein [Acidobacteriota bacterium]